MTAGFELGTTRGRAPILPNDGPVNGLARAAIPKQRRLALIRNADRPDFGWLHCGRLECARNGAEHALPDFLRLVLDPARLGKVLRELAVLSAERGAVERHDQRRGSGGALIDRENMACHRDEATRASLGRGARRPMPKRHT